MVVCVYVLRLCVAEVILRIEDEGLIVSEQWDGSEIVFEVSAETYQPYSLYGSE